MKSIKTFKQFNENYSESPTDLAIFSNNFIDNKLYEYDVKELHLSKEEDMRVKNKTIDSLNQMNSFQRDEISEELEKIAKNFACELEDLTNPVFVKEKLDREVVLSGENKELEEIQEGILHFIKEKLLKFFSVIFDIGSTLGSLFMIVSSIVENSFWGVVTGAMALTISILASAYISSKIK